MRPPYSVFIDIGSTSALLGGEELVARQASELAQTFGFSVKAAVSDTPSGAHVLAQSLSLACSSESHLICPQGAEKETLQHLSLPHLLHLHGVEVLARPIVVQQMTSFFYMLGFRTLGEVASFGQASFRERWGEVGTFIWKHLQGESKEIISPFMALQPLQEYVYLDFPVSLISLLLHEVRKASELLFARLQGRRLFAQSLVLRMRCEYSDARIDVPIEPHQANRDMSLFLTLLENKLEGLDLENPIRDFDIEIMTCAESVRQLGFFEPTTHDQDRLQTLLSVLKQGGLAAGTFNVKQEILPERSWSLDAFKSQASDETPAVTAKAASTSLVQHSLLSLDVGDHTTDLRHRNLSKDGLRFEKDPQKASDNKQTRKKKTNVGLAPPAQQTQAKVAYSEDLPLAPRPTRLLRNPRAFTQKQVKALRFLSRQPLERIESEWWHEEISRDYFFAVNDQGQCLWVYRDLKTHAYFLHGYFD